MDIIEKLKEIARKGKPARIIFPEGDDKRIIEAASLAAKERVAEPILLGEKKRIQEISEALDIDLQGIEIVEPKNSDKIRKYAEEYAKKKGLSLETAEKILSNTLFFGAFAVKAGDADGMIAGSVFTSGEVIAVSREIIGLNPNISVPSSFFLMIVPDFTGGENGKLIFADASVNPDPSPEDLADIAITTGETAATLFGWEPRVAMLSFSTKGSSEHALVYKVKMAEEIAKKKAPELSLEGELQADAALVLETAKKKMKDVGKVAGRANILIFPDLNSGNIAYKLVNILARAEALGPILQGFNKPVSDLSRGAKTKEIVKVVTLLAGWIKK
jgi:phosphate acetyltransferase